MSNSKPTRRDHPQPNINTRAGQSYSDPLGYKHRWDSMRPYAELLALHHDSHRTLPTC